MDKSKYRVLMMIMAAFLGITTSISILNVFGSMSREVAFAKEYQIDNAAMLDSSSSVLITITNVSDVIDGDTSSVENLLITPGSDGISLREAVEASNNTIGPEQIAFAEHILNQTIVLNLTHGFFPVLTGGGLSIDGDVNDDGIPDITVDCSLATKCFSIWSDDNIISGLKIVSAAAGVEFSVPNGYSGTSKTINNNLIEGNIIIGSNGIMIGPLGWNEGASNITWQNTSIKDNIISSGDGGIFLYAGANDLDNNRILTTTIQGNQVLESGSTSLTQRVLGITGSGGDIVALAGDTNQPGDPPSYAESHIVANLIISGNIATQIKVQAANMGNRDCHVSNLQIINNVVGRGGITVNTAVEIRETDGRPSHNNSISNVIVQGNTVNGAEAAIQMSAGGNHTEWHGVGNVDNLLENVKIISNTIKETQEWGAGIWLDAGQLYGSGESARNVVKDILISGNDIHSEESYFDNNGIYIVGGEVRFGTQAHVYSNTVQGITVTHNTIVDFDRGIWVLGAGGSGSFQNHHNTVSGVVVQGNTISNTQWGIAVGVGTNKENHGEGLFHNQVDQIIIANNLIEGVSTRQVDAGIRIYGGFLNQNTVVAENALSAIHIFDNQINSGTGLPENAGIQIQGGNIETGGQVYSNTIEAISVTQNATLGFAYGLQVYGGTGSGVTGSVVNGLQQDNQLSENLIDKHIADNQNGASNNHVFGNWWITPTASFTSSLPQGFSPLTVAFTNTSTGDYETLLWSFGDEITSTVEHPLHTCTTPGTYTVTLKIRGRGGSASEIKPNYVHVTENGSILYLPLILISQQ